MALEALDWPDEPSFTNLNDGAQSYNMGIRFSTTEEAPCPGVEWRVPDDPLLTPAGDDYVVSIWDENPVQLAAATFTPVPGGYQQVFFDEPITLTPGTNYVAAVYTRSYVFRASGGVYPSTPSGIAVADAGRLVADNGGPGVYPGGTSTGLFYVSPLIGTQDTEPEEHTTSATATATLAATAARSTSRPTSGTATAAMMASAARSTVRAVAAAGGLTVAATAARSSARLTAGRAELLAGASAARSSGRSTTGTARLLLAAYGTQLRAGAGPRLISSTRPSVLTSVSRPDVLATSTRG